MDQFNFIDDKKEKKSSSRKSFSGFIWSMGALYFFCMAVFLVGYFAMIYLDPQSQYNPFSPPLTQEAIATEIVIPDEEVTAEPSITPEVTLPTVTQDVPEPTEVPPTATAAVVIEPTATEVAGPIVTAVPTATDVSGLFFGAQEGSPVWTEHFSGSCTSMYVGGVVLDLYGAPMMDVVIELGGTLGGQPIYEEIAIAGMAPDYGESGFEFDLGAPQETAGTAYLLVLDFEGNVLSEYMIFPTMGDCTQNLTIFTIIQTRE